MARDHLFDLPESRDFDASQYHKLSGYLQDNFRETTVGPPQSVRSIRLDHRTLKTQEGYRYAAIAFQRVARALAPGLSMVIANVFGGGRPRDVGEEVVSKESACRIFNELTDLRFDAVLSEQQLVLNEEFQRIEGLLGPKTQFLENAQFLELVGSVLQEYANVEFAGANMTGRRLFVRYLGQDKIPTPMGAWRRGYAFCLDEAGDDAIRAYILYQRVECGSCCLQPPGRHRRQRQRRTGSKFAAKLRQLLMNVLREEPIDLAAGIQRLLGRRLFEEIDEYELGRVRRKWVQILRLATVPADISEGVAAAPLVSGHLGLRSPQQVLGRSEYDLFHALSSDALGRSQKLRELLERAAFLVFLKD